MELNVFSRGEAIAAMRPNLRLALQHAKDLHCEELCRVRSIA
jgi:hypothetical protein